MNVLRVRRWRHARAILVAAVGVGLACEPIAGDPGAAAPINACPAHPCDSYQKQPGQAPTCSAGVCAVAQQPTGLLLVIGLATDSYLAPGQTYIMVLDGAPLGSGPCQIQSCSPPVCHLPQWVPKTDGYVVAPSAATPDQANWYLGSANVGENTTLPVQATFRRTIGPSNLDAFDLGLPVEPVIAGNVSQPGGTPTGPDGTPEVQFQTYLQPGCYERTLQPFAPLSQAFPPEIKAWSADQGTTPVVTGFDTTKEETVPSGQKFSLPHFDIARREGLAGWTAYLRNIETKRIFSNVVPLTGSLAQNVKLLTNHVPAGAEALTGLELVLAAPADQPLPTYVVAPTGVPGSQELALPEMYPPLPTPVTMSGRIRTPAGAAVPADVYFTATDITSPTGQKFPPNFEFATHVSTTTDPRTGESMYSVLLPQGDYQVAVRPTDASSAIVVAPRAVGGEGNEMTGEDFDVLPLVSLSGSAVVADGRALAEAVVEVLPTQCSSSFEVSGVPDPGGACLPRSANTTTALDGSFALTVDPGQYLLRIRPRQGSRLPWKILPIVVGTTAKDLGPVVIPAPISVGMQLTDSAQNPGDNPIVNAVVGVFTAPAVGTPALQLGEAFTDGSGNYEMYIAPPDP
ncbi:MAG TPA: hypothetical protein VK762_18415 [Polyangiaceae bacterium]|nr:hypothetical protein [Polyangiaceae bacterium]